MIKLMAPDGGCGNYGSDSGGYDQLGVQTLTFTRDPISQRAAPSGLSGHLIDGSVVLSWWGSACATSYSVRRGNQTGGPYTTIATGITGLLSYTDKVAAGTYYYVVAANTSTTSVSNEVKVVGNPQLL
uniref:Uncharacterized protein n=1 Tax=Acrobeloides nanus TaxID=290746 RepID=A0A914E9Y4_9BILA